MGKIDMGIIYGKLYNSQTRTGEKFIDETGPKVLTILTNNTT